MKFKYLSLVLFIISLGSLFSQNSNELSDYLHSKTGVQNSHLFNGSPYSNEFRVLSKKNQFLSNSLDYTKGSVTTADNITFNHLDLRYDLFNQQLIIKPDQTTSHLGIIIDSVKIKQFTLYNHTFVNIKDYSKASGFCELAVDFPFFKLFIKHQKNKFKFIDGTLIHYEFENLYYYFIQKETNYYPINSKKEIIRLFPELKKDINLFYKQNQILERTNKYDFIKKLSIHIHSLTN